MKRFLVAAVLLTMLLAGCGSESSKAAPKGGVCSGYECDDVEVIYPAPKASAPCVRPGMFPPDAEPISKVEVGFQFDEQQHLLGALMIMQVGERCQDVFYGRFVPDAANSAPFEVTLRIGARSMTQSSEPGNSRVTAFTKGLYEPSSLAAISACVTATEQRAASVKGRCISR